MNCLVPRFLQGRFLTGLLLAYCTGVALCLLITPTPQAALILLLLSLLPGFLCALLKIDIRPALLLLGVVLGLFLCAQQMHALASCAFPENQPLVLEGRMQGGTVETENGGYRLTLKISSVDQKSWSCAPVYVYSEGAPPTPGSLLRITGVAYTSSSKGNDNAFDYYKYLQNQGIGATFYAEKDGVEVIQPGSIWSAAYLAGWLRRSLDQAFASLSTEHRALVRGVFLGDKSGLDQEQRNVLGLTGIAHAFAVSGLHIGYVVLLATKLVGPGYTRRWWRLLAVGLLLLLYLSLTGLRPSVVRAVLMALVLLAGNALDEPRDPLTNLSLAAFVSLLWKPLWLLDAGFQLSYGAVLGILLYQRPWYDLLSPCPRALRQAFSTGLAATTLTLPLIAYYFHHISWLGCLLSPFAVLAAGLSVSLAMVGALLSLVWTKLAGLLLQAAAWPLSLLYQAAEQLTALPFCASVSGALPIWFVSLFILALLALPRALRWEPISRFCKSRNLSHLPARCALLLLFLFSLLPMTWSEPDQDTTEVVFLDVGQGDATLVITPENNTILIDGGGTQDSGEVGQYTLLPYLKSRGITRIDLMISTHPDQDHIDGLLTVLDALDVGMLCYSSVAEKNAQQIRLLELAQANGVAQLPVRGQTIQVGDSTTLLFYPQDGSITMASNEASLVFQLRCEQMTILFTGDAPAEELDRLASLYDLCSTVVHLPHHGSETGYSSTFYESIHSQIAILSVGAQNRYGHPADLVVEYWQEHGTLYRTDQQGAITLYIRENGYTVETYR